MSTPSLYTLPTEILQRILDYIDPETIFFSFRIVCKYFYTITNSYNQYKLDFRSIPKTTFHRIRHLIQPENVVALILSDEHKTSGLIHLFRSLFDILKFTRLRSLTLLQISNSDLQVYLEHIHKLPLISLNVDNRIRWSSSTASQVKELFIHGSLKHLTLTQWSSVQDTADIFLNCSYLETLKLDGIFTPIDNDNFILRTDIKTKLKSLTIDFYSSNVDIIIWILSCTPSLIYLKLTGQPAISGMFWDGYWWTEFIQNNLPQLQSFEFFFDIRIIDTKSTDEIESIISSFRTSFWLDKKWYVTCDYCKQTRELQLYTVPLCKSTISYKPMSNKITSSTSINHIPYAMDNVCFLVLSILPTTTITSDKNVLPNYPLFPRVTKLTLLLTTNFSNDSIDYLSTLINFSHLEILSLTLDFGEQSFKQMSNVMNTLFNRTYNVQSISLHSTRHIKLIEFLTIIYPMIANQVKHLLIDVKNVNEMASVLERFTTFSSLAFPYNPDCSTKCKEIAEEFQRQGKDLTYCNDFWGVSFWCGKQLSNP